MLVSYVLIERSQVQLKYVILSVLIWFKSDVALAAVIADGLPDESIDKNLVISNCSVLFLHIESDVKNIMTILIKTIIIYQM